MTSVISLRQVVVDYPLLGVADYNLKRRFVTAIRGRHSDPKHIRALDGIDLEVREGDRIGLVGPNGAGKTTLLRVAAGLLIPSSGEAEIRRPIFSLLGETSATLNLEQTGLDNLRDLALLYGASRQWIRSRLDEIVDRSGLGDRINTPTYTYSSGMLARLRISVLLSFSPEILVMDEGIGAADNEFNESVAKEITSFITGTSTLIVSSHNLSLLNRYCNDVRTMNAGRFADSVEVVESSSV
jgi:lipopolysaccharide transport system ATP-binding protein